MARPICANMRESAVVDAHSSSQDLSIGWAAAWVVLENKLELQ